MKSPIIIEGPETPEQAEARRIEAVAQYSWTDDDDGEEYMEPRDAVSLMEAEAAHHKVRLDAMIAERDALAEAARAMADDVLNRLRKVLPPDPPGSEGAT